MERLLLVKSLILMKRFVLFVEMIVKTMVFNRLVYVNVAKVIRKRTKGMSGDMRHKKKLNG